MNQIIISAVPATINSAPKLLSRLRFSPSRKAPITKARATLSLVTGTTCDTCPS